MAPSYSRPQASVARCDQEVDRTGTPVPIPLKKKARVNNTTGIIKIKCKSNTVSTDDDRTFEKTVRLWDGKGAEEYCELRTLLDELIKVVPVDNYTGRFEQMSQILFGGAKANWENALFGLTTHQQEN